MSAPCSPLRYPGGKQILSSALAALIEKNNFEGQCYLEPYAGGAGAAFSLLFSEHVGDIRLNDADPAIFHLWMSILRDPDWFIGRLREVPLSIDEWLRQRAIYKSPKEHSGEDLGFAAFYLNRCNRSGIIANAGVIGGLKQTGQWKLDARFNRHDLESRIRKISLYSDRVSVHNLDAVEFLELYANGAESSENSFVYLDPPYFAKGSQLYLSYYSAQDHVKLASYLMKTARFPWVLTYDDVPEIRQLYGELNIIPLSLKYSAGLVRDGAEVLIHKRSIVVPSSWSKGGIRAA